MNSLKTHFLLFLWLLPISCLINDVIYEHNDTEVHLGWAEAAPAYYFSPVSFEIRGELQFVHDCCCESEESSLEGKIALCHSGNCSPEHKSRYMAKRDALGVIIYGHSGSGKQLLINEGHQPPFLGFVPTVGISMRQMKTLWYHHKAQVEKDSNHTDERVLISVSSGDENRYQASASSHVMIALKVSILSILITLCLVCWYYAPQWSRVEHFQIGHAPILILILETCSLLIAVIQGVIDLLFPFIHINHFMLNAFTNIPGFFSLAGYAVVLICWIFMFQHKDINKGVTYMKKWKNTVMATTTFILIILILGDIVVQAVMSLNWSPNLSNKFYTVVIHGMETCWVVVCATVANTLLVYYHEGKNRGPNGLSRETTNKIFWVLSSVIIVYFLWFIFSLVEILLVEWEHGSPYLSLLVYYLQVACGFPLIVICSFSGTSQSIYLKLEEEQDSQKGKDIAFGLDDDSDDSWSDESSEIGTIEGEEDEEERSEDEEERELLH